MSYTYLHIKYPTESEHQPTFLHSGVLLLSKDKDDEDATSIISEAKKRGQSTVPSSASESTQQ